MLITYDHPFCYVDSLGDKYEFYFFYDNAQEQYLRIRIEYKTPDKALTIFGYKTLSFSFAQPFVDGKIIWDARPRFLVNVIDVPIDAMSWEAKSMANKLLKLKAFL